MRIMKMVVLLLSLTIVTGCSQQVQINTPIVYGNSNGNISNGGFEPEHRLDGYLYYLSAKESVSKPHLVRWNEESTELEVITEDVVTYLNIYDEWIYYVNKLDGHIYRIKFDGSDHELVCDESCESLFIVHDLMYYTTSNNEGFILYSMKNDGINKQEILELDSPTFNIANNKIYYWQESGSIFSYDILNHKNERIMDDVTDRFQIYNDILFAVGTENQLYKSDGNGGKTLIVSKVGKRFQVYNDNIFFVKPNKTSIYSGKIFKVDLNGNNEQKINESNESDVGLKSYISVCDGMISFFDGINYYSCGIK